MTAIINKPKKRVAIYCRVSTTEQAETWTSLSSQKEKLLDYIKYNHREYTINENKHIYIERWESWAKDDRPSLNKMFRDAEEWEFDIIMVYKVDRLFRKTVYLLQSVENLYELWIWFKSITQEFDTSTSNWRMILWILWVIWELERDTIRERTVLWKTTRAKEWYYVWWGWIKFWYNVKEVDWRKVLTVNEEEAIIVNEIFKLYWEEWKSLQEIANLLTSRNIQTKYDKLYDWNEKNRKMKACHWYSSNISNIVKDEMYIWKYHYWKTYTKMNKQTLKITTHYRKVWDPMLVELTCPIVLKDENLFNKCRELAERNILTKNNKKSHNFTWFISCWKCGRNYRWYRTSKKTLSYKCWWSTTWKTPVDCKCNNPQVSEKILTSEIWNKIIFLFNDTDRILENYYKRDNKENNIFLEYQNDLNKVILEIES